MTNTNSIPGAGASVAHDFAVGDELRGERATLGKSLLDVQRDLRIKAAFIAAIEDADISVFPNKGVIPGYVRSYARYLGLDSDTVYRRFCRETGFSSAASRGLPVTAAKSGTGVKTGAAARTPRTTGTFHPDFPLAERRGVGLPAIPFSAIGSLVVLVALVAGLGYGGWTVLRNIQRVQFAPVEELPLAVAEVDVMTAPTETAPTEPALTDLASPVAATALADLYRHQEAEVPILVPRDGPIASIDPDKSGLLAGRMPDSEPRTERTLASATDTGGLDPQVQAVASAVAASVGRTVSGPMLPGAPIPVSAQLGAEGGQSKLTVVAERAAWIRVYLENGTIIFERILEKGESYSPPEGVGAPRIWAGNAGSVYVKVGDALHGPLGRGTRAVRDVVLEPASVLANFALVDQVPEVISQSMGTDAARLEPAVALR